MRELNKLYRQRNEAISQNDWDLLEVLELVIRDAERSLWNVEGEDNG